jgi:hypothetical protein
MTCTFLTLDCSSAHKYSLKARQQVNRKRGNLLLYTVYLIYLKIGAFKFLTVWTLVL